MAKIDFQWDFTDANFTRMMNHEITPDVFGSVRFGLILGEFRCTGGGYDPEHHVPTTDIFVWGKSEAEYPYIDNYLKCGMPYLLLDDEIPVPKRRLLDNFKVAFELRVIDWLNGDGKIHYTEAIQETVSRKAWEFEGTDGEG